MPDDDEEASGPPPHPLDRVWFHPSELGSSPSGAGVTTFRPQPAAPRVWVVAAIALLVGIAGALGVVSVVGTFTDPSTPSNRLQRAAPTAVADPDAIATLVTTVGRSIVTISVAPAAGGEAAIAGSGVVVAPDRVLTAAHLLAGRSAPTVITVGSQVVPAEILGVDVETDLAVLKVDSADLVPARLATGDGLRIGQTVAALASGSGTRRWVSAGVISGLNQVAPLASGIQGTNLIETDARFQGTAAGGALLNSNGAVVGILTGPERLAVSIDVARDVVAQITTTGRAAHGALGVIADIALDRSGGGVRIFGIVAGSPAEIADLHVDDIVLSVGDAEIGTKGDLMASLRRLKPGDPVDVTVVRAGKRIAVPVVLGRSEAVASTAALIAA